MATTASKYEAHGQTYEIHAVANVFPRMSSTALERLRDDIKLNGQQEPIVLWKGRVIDGRHRLEICTELQIEPKFIEIDPLVDPVAYAVSHNLHRRHLSESQRSLVANRLTSLKRSEQAKVQICTIEAAAKIMSVSTRTVKSARKVETLGSKEVIEAVEKGELAVSTAARLVTQVPDKSVQTKIVVEGPTAIKAAAVTVPKRISKGSGVPKPVTTIPIDSNGALDHTCKRCAKYSIKNHKLIAENKQLTDALSYARGQLSEQTDAGLFPFLDKCQKFWNEADGVGKAAMHNWLDKQKIVPESEPSQKNDSDWRPARHEVVVEVTS